MAAKKKLIDKAELIANKLADDYLDENKELKFETLSQGQTLLDTLTKFLTLKNKIDEDGEEGARFKED